MSMSYYFGEKSMGETIEKLSALDTSKLVASIVNENLNSLIARHSDGVSTGVPYIGWFWRETDIAGGRITIGDAGDHVGVMENNKWDYAERDLTADEAKEFADLVWQASLASRKGGNLATIEAETQLLLNAAGEFISALEVPGNRNDY